MSCFASVPTQEVVIFSANTSAPPKVSTTFGQVPVRLQRSRMPRAGQVPHVVLVARPPLRAFAAHLVELEHAVGLAPARVVRHAPPGDQRPGAFVHDAPRLVLVHAEVDEVAREVARLRRAADDRPASPRRRAGCVPGSPARSGRTSRGRGTPRCPRRARTGPSPCRRAGRASSGRSRFLEADLHRQRGHRRRAAKVPPPQNFQSLFGTVGPR